MIEFVAYGHPQPAGSKTAMRNRHTGKIVVIDAAKQSRPWKSHVASVAGAAVLVAGGQLLEGPLSLRVTFYVPRPKGHYGKRGLRASAPGYPAVRPDVTKLLRAVEDACNGVLWRDDSQIVSQHALKLYGEPARAEISVRLLAHHQQEDT